MLPIVAIFTSNRSLRETLGILLEHDCHVQAMPPAATATLGSAPSLAVVASPAATVVAARIRDVWPDVPVVVIREANEPAPARDETSEIVPLDPHAIRRAVLKHLRPSSDGTLRLCAAAIGESLKAAWQPRLRRLRRELEPMTTSAREKMRADLAALMADHALLQRFVNRPPDSRQSSMFIGELASLLREELMGSAFDFTVEEPLPRNPAQGPLALAAVLASLLAAAAQPQSTQAIQARATEDSLYLSFAARRDHHLTHVPLALVLVGLALEPWSWRVLIHSDAAVDIVQLSRDSS